MKHKRQQIDAENLQLAALYGPLIQQQAAAASLFRNSAGLFPPGATPGLEPPPFLALPGSPAAALIYNNTAQLTAGLNPLENPVGLPFSNVLANGNPIPIPMPTSAARTFPAFPGANPLLPTSNQLPHELLKLTSSLVGQQGQPIPNMATFPAKIPTNPLVTCAPSQLVVSPTIRSIDSALSVSIPKNEPSLVSSSDGQKPPVITNPNAVELSSVKPPHILTEKLQKLIQCVVQND